MKRLKKILDKSDKLGMVTILGIYYFGQEKYIDDEAAVKAGIKNVCNWVLKNGYTNVIIEIDNESDFYHKHNILKTAGVHEAIALAKSVTYKGRRLLVSVSNGGGRMPTEATVKEADFILLHGNGQHKPEKIVNMVNKVRSIKGYTPKPILFNEDDHFDFEKPMNNFIAATSAGASWGYFDYRKKGEPFEVGYQCVPVDWGSNTDRKKQFYKLLREWTK